jgi:hypothetical protein
MEPAWLTLPRCTLLWKKKLKIEKVFARFDRDFEVALLNMRRGLTSAHNVSIRLTSESERAAQNIVNTVKIIS